jgi:hypothetical protein
VTDGLRSGNLDDLFETPTIVTIMIMMKKLAVCRLFAGFSK